VERVGFRKPPPSCEQAIKDLGLEGQPVNCEEPPPPTYDPPQMHGKYRLFPGSYVGPLTYEDSPDAAPPGVISDDLDAIQASSMYVEPAWLPEGYSLSSINTNGYDSEHVIAATYTGPGEPIQINRVRRSEWPVDIIQPVGDSPVVYDTPVLAGVPAVLSYPKPGSPSPVNETLLRFAEADVETVVVGDHLRPEAATQIGLSLICGTSCVSSLQALPHAADGVTPEAFVESQGAGQQTAVTLRGAVASPETSTVQEDDEHRVIAGLGVTDVEAVYWGAPYNGYWHGWSDYGEAALDLRRPGDPWTNGTIGTPVYVITWAWSGGGVLHFETRDYSISTACTGRYVDLKDSGNNTLGALSYVHLDSMQPEHDTWTSLASGWTIRYVGTVAGSQPGCSWEAPHLHEGMTTASTNVWYNTAVPDSQGRINPTNPAPPSYNWMFKVTLIDSDGDGVPDTSDNCPSVYNPGQENFDADGPPGGNGPGIGNGTGIAGNDATVPNGDGWGDACDTDDDNDGLADGSDSDPRGDVTYDDDNDGIWKGAGDDGPSWDANMNAKRDGVEAICPLAVNPGGDDDGDGLLNTWEVCKWGTDPSYWDTDGDGLHGDCKEAMDVNGNGLVTNADATFIKQAYFDLIGKDGDFDINGNNLITAADATFVKQAVFGVNPCQ
jgi:hypothetical protein